MINGKNDDPTNTYVLEETAITKVSSLDELAELAARQDSDCEEQSSSTGDRNADPRQRASRKTQAFRTDD